MPNWCYNHLTIESGSNGDEQGFKVFKTKLFLMKEDLEQNKGVWTGVCDYFVGREDDHETDWYEHNCRVYGAKWQPDVEEFINGADNTSGDYITISFDSAWSPLNEFTKKLAEIYNLRIEHQFEETGNDFAGQLIVDGSDVEEEWSAGYWEGTYRLDSDNFFEQVSNEFEYWTENIELDGDATDEEWLEGAEEEFESHSSDLRFLSTKELNELKDDFIKFVQESQKEKQIEKASGLSVHTYYVVEGRIAKFTGYNTHSGYQFNDKKGWFAFKESLPEGITLSEKQEF
jgi:hypothetical protein